MDALVLSPHDHQKGNHGTLKKYSGTVKIGDGNSANDAYPPLCAYPKGLIKNHSDRPLCFESKHFSGVRDGENGND